MFPGHDDCLLDLLSFAVNIRLNCALLGSLMKLDEAEITVKSEVRIQSK